MKNYHDAKMSLVVRFGVYYSSKKFKICKFTGYILSISFEDGAKVFSTLSPRQQDVSPLKLQKSRRLLITVKQTKK